MNRLVAISLILALTTSSCKGNEPDAGGSPGLSVSPVSLHFKAEGGTETLSVTAEGDWGLAIEDKSICSASHSMS